MLKKLVDLVWEEDAPSAPKKPVEPVVATSVTVPVEPMALTEALDASTYKKVMKNIEDLAYIIPEERTRFLAAFRSLSKVLALTKASLLKDAQEQKAALDERYKTLAAATSAKGDAAIEVCDKARVALGADVDRLSAEIARLTAELKSVQAKYSEADSAQQLARTKKREEVDKLKTQYEAQLSTITEDIRKITMYIEETP